MSTVRKTFGLACPRCGSDENIVIETTTCVRLHPDGTEDVGDQEWTCQSYCACHECDWSGRVADFTIPYKEGAR